MRDAPAGLDDSRRRAARGLGLLGALALLVPSARAEPLAETFVKGEQVFAATLEVGAREKATGIRGDGSALYVVHVEGTATSPGGRAFDGLYLHADPTATSPLPMQSARIELRSEGERVYRDFELVAPPGSAQVAVPPYRRDHVYDFLWQPRAGGPISIVSPPVTFSAPSADALQGRFVVTIHRAVRAPEGKGTGDPKAPGGEGTDAVGPRPPDRPDAIDLAPGRLESNGWKSGPAASGRALVEDDRLVLELAVTDDGGRCFAQRPLRGDFDVTVEYALLDWTAGPRASPSLDVYFSGSPGVDATTIQVSRADFEGARMVFVAPGDGQAPAVAGKEGRLRIRRAGADWQVWQDAGSAWQRVANLSRPMGESVWMGFGLTKNGDGTAKVAIRPRPTDASATSEVVPKTAKPDDPKKPSEGAATIVGTWDLVAPAGAGTPSPGQLVFAADHSVTGPDGRRGTWTQTGRTVLVTWPGEREPVALTLRRDLSSLLGHDGAGNTIHATRRK